MPTLGVVALPVAFPISHEVEATALVEACKAVILIVATAISFADLIARMILQVGKAALVIALLHVTVTSIEPTGLNSANKVTLPVCNHACLASGGA